MQVKKKEATDYLNCVGICYLNVSLSLASTGASPWSVETVKDLKAQLLSVETGRYLSTCTCQEILLTSSLSSLTVSLLVIDKVYERKYYLTYGKCFSSNSNRILITLVT